MTSLKYNLKQITDISYSGFHFKIPEDTHNIINYLCVQVGSSCINSNVFSKLESPVTIAVVKNTNELKKKRGNKGMEVSSEKWENTKPFQTTKIEQKTGIDGEINEIRLYLNKLTDKTFLDIREKIIEKINAISFNPENSEKMGTMLYEFCSTNKFYSRIFADIFAELASMYDWLKHIFDKNYDNIMEQYNNIKYVDSNKDYDGFCEMNKQNEKRRAITAFYVNLAINGFIKKNGVIKILINIITSIMNMINIIDKKNEVDELTEIIGILFNKELLDDSYEDVNSKGDEPEEFYVLKNSIIGTISSLAKKKVKDYPSLSNKAIFKYMDLIEM
jgi:roadblock/LC7 domain-containing protein